MCQFFSFVTDPAHHPAEYYHFDWEYRKAHSDDEGGADSHSHICSHFKLNEDRCNKYEFNPLTKAFKTDQINSKRDDSEAAEKWANRLDFKTIVEPLIIKPVVNPFKLPKVEKPTDEQIRWLKGWTSVWSSIGDSVWYSIRSSAGDSVVDAIGDSVWASVRDSAWYSIWASVVDSVWASVRDSVWAYVSSFSAIDFKHDFSPTVNLWNAGLVPSFDGTVWRLHSGKNADIVYEWMPEVQE